MAIYLHLQLVIPYVHITHEYESLPHYAVTELWHLRGLDIFQRPTARLRPCAMLAVPTWTSIQLQ